MPLTLARGARRSVLLDHLVEHLDGLALGPFGSARVIVATRETARVTSQEVSSRLGISAGIAYVTPAELMRSLADVAGVGADRSRWLGTPLDMAVQAALAEVAAAHPLLRAAWESDGSRPGRRRATAVRLARLLRSYVDLEPDLVSSWLDGGEDGPGGVALPEAARWQPALLRAAVAAVEVDPLETLGAVLDAARLDPTPTLLLGVDHLTVPDMRVLGALAQDRPVTLVQKSGTAGERWALPLSTRTVDLPGAPLPPPVVAVHDSHGEARQVEVLRDELTRAFADDPTLEPRDVAIVCPQPERYAALLDAAFSPGDASGLHPGRQLRVQQVGGVEPNPLVLLLVDLLRLGSSRATASGLVELLLRPAIAHRWRLTDRHTVVELVSGAGIRWGLDSAQRSQFGLADVAQNTWLRGLDRLLVGLAVAPGDDAGLGLSGAEVVAAPDMDTVGSLCEIVSRLRHLIAATSDAATIPAWVRRCRAALDSLVGLPRADEWQQVATARLLTRLETDHAADLTQLTRHEFTLLLADLGTTYRRRAAAGNGSLAVLSLGELPHVEFRLVALLGVTDDVVPGRTGLPADCVDLGDAAPDPRIRRRDQLLEHALCAERLLIVRQARSQRTNDKVALPVAISWLLDRLGAAPSPVAHPPTATSAGNFHAPASFDSAALAGALARRGRTALPGRHQRRRTAARTRPVGTAPEQVSIEQLAQFLADPARAFLKSAAGITVYRAAEVSDEIPLEAGGLQRWAIMSDLLGAWKAGLSGDEVETALRHREEHPPLAIGRLAFESARADAWSLWELAGSEWASELEEHRLSLTLDLAELGVLELTGDVRTRGGAAVAVTASTGDEQLIAPWLESLALAACGHASPARLYRLVRVFGDVRPQSLSFTVEDQADATQWLSTVARAYALGQHRLLAVPATPAIQFARETAAGTFAPSEWAGGFRGYRQRKWNWPGRSWEVFFDSDVSELFTDEPLPTDPANGSASAFAAWASALYGPLVRSLA